MDQTERECLLAWLRGFRQHWPEGFARIVGQVGDDTIARLAVTGFDPNRYLKLRRIAIENLSRML